MPRPESTVADRRRGLLAGLFPPASDGPAPGELALARISANAAGEQEIDLARVVGEWVALRSSVGLDSAMAASLGRLVEQGPPIGLVEGPGTLGAAVVTLPLVLRTAASNANLVSGAFHLGCLLDPTPTGSWAAVAVSVVAACFLQGRRDFAPDLISALRANDAPGELLAAVRRIPIRERVHADHLGNAAAVVGELCWAVHHLGDGGRVRAHLIGYGDVAALLGDALVGARDGSDQPLEPGLEQLLERLNLESM